MYIGLAIGAFVAMAQITVEDDGAVVIQPVPPVAYTFFYADGRLAYWVDGDRPVEPLELVGMSDRGIMVVVRDQIIDASGLRTRRVDLQRLTSVQMVPPTDEVKEIINQLNR